MKLQPATRNILDALARGGIIHIVENRVLFWFINFDTYATVNMVKNLESKGFVEGNGVMYWLSDKGRKYVRGLLQQVPVNQDKLNELSR